MYNGGDELKIVELDRGQQLSDSSIRLPGDASEVLLDPLEDEEIIEAILSSKRIKLKVVVGAKR